MGLDLDLEVALRLQLRSSPAHISFFFCSLSVGKESSDGQRPHRRRNGYLHKLGKGALGVTKKEFDQIYFTFGYLSKGTGKGWKFGKRA